MSLNDTGGGVRVALEHTHHNAERDVLVEHSTATPWLTRTKHEIPRQEKQSGIDRSLNIGLSSR